MQCAHLPAWSNWLGWKAPSGVKIRPAADQSDTPSAHEDFSQKSNAVKTLGRVVKLV
jgi:hypothetical protein